ncbi:uncharacterized protein [Battus philenor]|uniref:uncharacterized protein n=1 Tax=Battus philenor TaxID=42288 RepID=UPI0035CF2A4F
MSNVGYHGNLVNPSDFLRPVYQLQLTRVQQSIMDDLSWGIKLQILKDITNPDRRVGMQLLVDGRRQGEVIHRRPSFQDNEIKLKLFRMMHESISDSEAKIKRAEIIRKSYENNTSFEVGFIVADTTDKYSSMVDISAMLQRLFTEWKPIEHINAYEHIANKGIEINHLIELVKTVMKRNNTVMYYRRFLNLSL